MLRIVLVLCALAVGVLGCGRTEAPPAPNAGASTSTPEAAASPAGGVGTAEKPASASTVGMGTPVRFDVPGYEGRLYVEARATGLVAGTASGEPAGGRSVVRVCRKDGTDAGTVGWARRELSVAWEPTPGTPSASWAGVIPDHGTAVIIFRHCEVAPGVSAGFDQLGAEVTAHLVDAQHVAFAVRINVVECVR